MATNDKLPIHDPGSSRELELIQVLRAVHNRMRETTHGSDAWEALKDMREELATAEHRKQVED